MMPNICQMCGEDRKRLHEHHALPMAFGGTDGDIVVACVGCHRKAEGQFMRLLLDPFGENGYGFLGRGGNIIGKDSKSRVHKILERKRKYWRGYAHKWYQKHKERKRKYYQKHRDKRLEYQQKYNQEHKEQLKEYHRRCHQMTVLK